MRSSFLVIGCIFAALTVAIGAFGAHALKEILLENGKTETFKTGVLYQMFHSIALLVTGLLYPEAQKNSLLNGAGYLFVSGILLFSGSLYILSISGITILGAVTPFGGLCFIAGWMILIYHLLKSN
ncbi:MAG: DUF423 domain-containing protein [Cyclobacteriaceae bacterium]